MRVPEQDELLLDADTAAPNANQCRILATNTEAVVARLASHTASRVECALVPARSLDSLAGHMVHQCPR